MEQSTLARDKISQAYLGLWGDGATQERAKNRIDWLAVNARGPEILDIGCSEGILPILLGREGNQVTGIDVNPDALSYASSLLKKENKTVQTNVSLQLENILSPDDSQTVYDTVIIAEVVEHLFHPQLAIKNAAQKLKPEGRLLLTTPFGFFPDPDHHQTFTLTDIVRKVEPFCMVENLSIVDGYIRIIGKNKGNSDQKDKTISTEKILQITEKAAISAQKQLRSNLSEAVIIRSKLQDRNQDLNKRYQDLNNKLQDLNNKLQDLNNKNKVIAKNLDLANRKYRDVTNTNRNIQKINQQNNKKITILNRELQKSQKEIQTLSFKKQQIANKLTAAKNSEAWKIGYVTVKALREPGKNTILWIPRLVKIFLLCILQPKQSPQISRKQSKKKINTPPVESSRPAIYTIKDVAPVKLDKTESFHLRDKVTADNLFELRVACVMDEFTYNAYAPVCNLLQLTPENWEVEIEEFQPDLLFIESAWRGKDGLWNRKVNYPGGELSEVIAWCNRKMVPTSFWNKEDPVHFQTFINRAKLFDFVFTTDIDCISSYKKALQSDRVYLLPFGAQPILHNPIEKYDRKDSFCFAGAYYPRYPDRIKDFNTFFDALSQEQGVDIFDRNYNEPDSEFAFPDKYRSHILGYLPHDKIDVAYKGYRYGINMNSIKRSPSMFARRVFELVASNTITVSNYSKGVRDFFGDLVVSTDDAENLCNQLVPFKSDETYYKKIRLIALRKVLLQHTYGDRLAYVAEKTWNLRRKDTLPFVTVIGLVTDSEQLENIINSFDRQNYKKKKLVIVTAENFFPLNLPDRVQIITWKHACEIKIGEIVSDDYVSCFYHNDYYGKHYILDIMLATKYCNADAIGKKTINTCNGDIFTKHSDGNEYKVIDQLPYRSSILKAKILEHIHLSEWLLNFPSGAVENSECFSVDEFNYCKDYLGNACPHADDLQEINTGLALRDIEQMAEDIKPVQEQYRLTQLDGNELQELISHDTSGKVRLRKEQDHLNVNSILEGDKSITLNGQKIISLDQTRKNKDLKIFFDASPGLKLQLILYFYDENFQKLTHKIIDANRNYHFPTLNFSLLQVGLRITGKGNGAINRLVFDYLPKNDPFMSKAETLLLTPQYPTYADLYRFGFVHSRVVQYQPLGMLVDVLRFNDGFAEEYFEFNNINVVSGSTDTLRQALNGGRYSSVLVHYLTQGMWDVLREFVGRIPIIIWLHGAEVQPWYRRKFNYTTHAEEQQAKESSDKRMTLWHDVFSNLGSNIHFVFVSQYFADEVMKDMGVKLTQKNYSIIHNIINTELFSYIPKTAEQRKKLLSIRPYASATYANDLTAKAILELSKESFFPELEFRIIGDGILFEEILQPLRKFDNVIIEKRFLKQEEIADLHRDYGIFLTPSRMDSQGVSRDEAMSSGLVPITNNVTAIPEFVDKQCGMLVAGEDYKGMAEAITRLYHDPDLFLRLSENAAARVRKQSSRKQTVEKEISLIKSMAKNMLVVANNPK